MLSKAPLEPRYGRATNPQNARRLLKCAGEFGGQQNRQSPTKLGSIVGFGYNFACALYCFGIYSSWSCHDLFIAHLGSS